MDDSDNLWPDSLITSEQLYSTKSYKDKDLSGVGLVGNDLTGWNFAGQNLENANFHSAIMTDADFTDAEIKRVDFSRYISVIPISGTGISKEQLVSTWSYKNKDLSGVKFGYSDYSDMNFRGMNLTETDFSGVDITMADFRGAQGLNIDDIPDYAIDDKGAINWLYLGGGDFLNIENYDIGITVNDILTVENDSILRLDFDDNNWGSTINVHGEVYLGGTLEFAFADGVDIASLIGTSFKIFEWNGLLAEGDMFGSIVYANGTQWDVSGLYTTGEVVLTAVPEPMTIAMLCLGGLMIGRKRKNFNQNKEILRKI